jgi:hypothetical protein
MASDVPVDASHGPLSLPDVRSTSVTAEATSRWVVLASGYPDLGSGDVSRENDPTTSMRQMKMLCVAVKEGATAKAVVVSTV